MRRKPADHLLGGCFIVHGEMSQLGQRLPGEIPRVGGASVQNHNVHGLLLLPLRLYIPQLLFATGRRAGKEEPCRGKGMCYNGNIGGGLRGIWSHSGGHGSQCFPGCGFLSRGRTAGTGVCPVQRPVHAGSELRFVPSGGCSLPLSLVNAFDRCHRSHAAGAGGGRPGGAGQEKPPPHDGALFDGFAPWRLFGFAVGIFHRIGCFSPPKAADLHPGA